MRKLLLLLMQSLHTASGSLLILPLIQALHTMFTLTINLKATENFNFWQKLLQTCATYAVATHCSRNHLISEKYKKYNHLSYISFKTVPFCNYTLVPATVNVLVHSWKQFYEILFSSTVAFLMMSLVLKRGVLSFHAREQVKQQLQPGQESTGDVPVLSHCSLL
jgi:hypothetical protein